MDQRRWEYGSDFQWEPFELAPAPSQLRGFDHRPGVSRVAEHVAPGPLAFSERIIALNCGKRYGTADVDRVAQLVQQAVARVRRLS